MSAGLSVVHMNVESSRMRLAVLKRWFVVLASWLRLGLLLVVNEGSKR